MPRGGRRENAGRKSNWDSGRSFSETKLIRVPIEFAEQLLELAHKLDAGETIETVEEVERLQECIGRLEERVERVQGELKELKAQLTRIELDKERDYILSHELKLGSQAPGYKKAKSSINVFIAHLLDRVSRISN
jgi:DNA repair exonuclease SbcCD ATPase subunit